MIICNRMRTPDGTIIESRSRHDYVTHIDLNGDEYMVDGGREYLRRSINTIPATDLSVYSHDPHEVIREAFMWGTYGKNGDEPLNHKVLSSMSDDHIKAILSTIDLTEEVLDIFVNELNYREDNGIEVLECLNVL